MTVVMLVALLFGFSEEMKEDPVETTEIAEAVLAGAERESLDPVMVLSVIAQESSFQADPCSRRVALDRVVSREPVEGHPDREVLTWTCGSESGTRAPCSRTVWEVVERGEYLLVNTCPAGEVGYMQVLGSSQWARAGYPIPGTEVTLVLMADGVQTVFFLWHGATKAELAVLVDGERLARSAFQVTEESGPNLVFDEAPAESSNVVAAEALSTSSADRRRQLLDARVNVALGCRELAEHREAAKKTSTDPWWEWVGSYNTGTAHGAGARRYARRILGRYSTFCRLTVEGEVLLQDAWPACADVEEALQHWHANDDDELPAERAE
jgi:hypothetical protein